MNKLGLSLIIAAQVAALISTATVHAGAFLGSSLIPDGVTFPKGYAGTESVVALDVCIVPGSPNAEQMRSSLKNSIAVWNQRRSTSANLRNANLPAGLFDFESTALHELGHCIGLGHPNLGFSGGNGNEGFSQSTHGIDAIPNLLAGTDTVAGTGDDVRGDDRNTHYFHIGTNNPFTEPETIDATTYSNDVAQLPSGDFFAANANRSVSLLPRYKTPFTEAAMQQGAFESEVQRTLSHDDVSTLRYAMSGLDRNQGTADDYRVVLRDGGISSSNNCDINVSMDAAMTGFAICSVIPSFVGNNIHIQSSSIFFNPNIDWFYNSQPPCSESTSLPADVWVMFSVPCQVGISTSAKIADVIGDDLPADRYNIDWVMFTYEYNPDRGGGFTGSYRQLDYTESLQNGVGYWIINRPNSVNIDVQGEYSSQIDSVVHVDADSPNQFGWNLVGQPFRYPAIWADSTAIDTDGTVLSLSEADPAIPGVPATSCTLATGPIATCTVASIGFVYDSATESYKAVNLQTGSVPPASAVWIYAGKSDIKFRFTMPIQERLTP